MVLLNRIVFRLLFFCLKKIYLVSYSTVYDVFTKLNDSNYGKKLQIL